MAVMRKQDRACEHRVNDAKAEMWHGAYDDGWRDLIVPDAFSHPAKMSRGLVVRIFDELFAMGALHAGDLVVDPFAGIGSTGIEAAARGVRFIGCELEPKFVELAQQNFAKHRQDWADMDRPQPVIVQGDSRHLRAVLSLASVDVCVSSPSYQTEQMGGGGQKREDKVLRAMMDGYGETPSQLGAMPAGSVAAVVSSPPYAGNAKADYLLSEDGKTRARDERRGFSQGRGCFRGSEAAYGESDGQLGRMDDERGVDAVISSPPYAEIASGSGGLNTLPATVAGQQSGRSASSASQDTDSRYGTAAGQLARMALGDVAAVVSSPPYEHCLDDRGRDSVKTEARKERFNVAHPEMAAHIQKPVVNYAGSEGNIGTEHGETFWSAARDIVAESFAILKPGGVAVWVVKSFVRNKQIVDFPGDWRRLCEHVGFVTTLEVHASLVSETTHGDLFDGSTIKRRERKSFFRRLAESKGSPRIDFETVLFMRKPDWAEAIPDQVRTDRCGLVVER